MNDDNPDPIPSANPPPEPATASGSTPPQEPLDWREQRRRARWAHHEDRWQERSGRRGGWIFGALLILVGLALLLQQMGVAVFTNWWALFILFPAFACFVAAWDAFQAPKRRTRRAISALVVGVLLTLVALGFLFNFYPLASFFWPALLLLGGLALLVTALFPE